MSNAFLKELGSGLEYGGNHLVDGRADQTQQEIHERHSDRDVEQCESHMSNLRGSHLFELRIAGQPGSICQVDSSLGIYARFGVSNIYRARMPAAILVMPASIQPPSNLGGNRQPKPSLVVLNFALHATARDIIPRM